MTTPNIFHKKNKYAESKIGEELVVQSKSYWQDSFRRLLKNKVAVFCGCLIILIAVVALAAPLLSPYDPNLQELAIKLQSPSSEHLLGTDEYGRDILSRIIYGTRVSLAAGIVSQLMAIVIGVTLGAVAGYYGGKVDIVISRIMEIFAAFPDLLLAMAIMFALGTGITSLYISLAIISWVQTARMVRGQVMQLKEKEFVEACIASGGSGFRVIVKHMIPNCISTIIVLVTLGIPGAILTEASLSFLGIGIQPPDPSWGSMISYAQPYIASNPLYSIFPGVAIIVTVIAFNMFGDGLRDALDPKLKN
ncbi:MAG: ABC transporter permease [Eubacterium sp.]|nr:ABC transporter permease [Eubacterium sp.]